MKRFINEVIDHFQISPKGKQILFQLVILKLYLNCLGPHQFGYCIVDLTSTCYDSTTKKIAHSLMGQLPPRLNPPQAPLEEIRARRLFRLYSAEILGPRHGLCIVEKNAVKEFNVFWDLCKSQSSSTFVFPLWFINTSSVFLYHLTNCFFFFSSFFHYVINF